MRALLGRQAPAFFDALEGPPLTGLRVNTQKLSPEEFKRLVPWTLEPVPWCPAGFIVQGDERPALHPYHAAGLFYMQEPSAMAVAEALAPKAGERVLDLAAAPGGKTTHASNLMGARGILVANELSRGRSRALLENLERWGAKGAMVANEVPARLAASWGPAFDRVLLDAPCSGEGMFRKSEDAPGMWSEASVLGCARRQGRLLREAAALVRPGGLLAYSTCTFAPEENEGAIAAFLEEQPDFETLPLALPGASPGRPEWLGAGSKGALEGALRFWPHLAPGEGHFAAVLRRVDGSEARSPGAVFRPVPAKVAEMWRRFVGGALGTDPATGNTLTQFGDRIFAVPEGMPDIRGLQVLRTGLALAHVRKDRLEPAHALALALTREEASGCLRVDLEPEDERLARYLRGEVLEDAGPEGWLLVTASGFPLGWGKRAKGTVKNFYPKGLRRP